MTDALFSFGWKDFVLQMRDEQGRAHERAAELAHDMMRDAELVVPRAERRKGFGRGGGIDAHPFLLAKGFPDLPGHVLEGRLLVPMFDVAENELCGVQRIDPDGTRSFLPGQKVIGAVHWMGTREAPETWLCAKFECGLTLRAALKRLYRKADVVVCFRQDNLAHVAKILGTHVMVDGDEPEAEGIAIDTLLPYVKPPIGLNANGWHLRDGLEHVCSILQTLAEYQRHSGP